MEINYLQAGDYLIPDIQENEEPAGDLNKYGRMRLNYLKEQKPEQYSHYLMNGTLKAHCLEIQKSAEEMMDNILPKLREQYGVTEELKRQNQMKWVGLMNNLQAMAEETVMNDLICQ